MSFRDLFLTAVATFIFTTMGIHPGIASGDTFDKAKKAAIETIIHDYLLANPEVLFQSIGEYRKRQEQTAKRSIKQKLAGMSDILLHNPGSPVGGNIKGDVSIVEFFDYRCPYCKKVFPDIQQLLKEDGNIRYVLKELPILGQMSVIATRASLAAWSVEPGKYAALHAALMTSRGQLDEARIFKYVKQAGYDVEAIRSKMKAPAVETEIRTNSRLAQELNINGTPAFVIGDHVVPGVVDMETMKQLIAAARKR